MSLRLRILLLITAVNVAVLVLVVYVGLQVVEDVDPVGTSAFLEGLQVATAERPLDRPWERVRLMVRIKAPGNLPEPYAPPGFAQEAEEAQALLLDAIQRGNTGITRGPGRLIVVHPEGTQPVRAFYVAFHSRANEESLATLARLWKAT